MHRFSKIPYVALAKLSLVATLSANTSFTTAAHSELHSSIVTLPTFSASSNLKRNPGVNIDLEDVATLDSMMLIGGTGHKKLSQEIADIIQVPLANTSIGRFADGEVTVQVNENIRSKDVYIIQPCYQPVHDSIVELLLTISCVRRAGAERVIAVIPYLGYKHHRRGSPISTKHHSRYLTSAAVDFAKMLEEVGVDRVISVDLQRPGQGHEACFFDNNIPLETIMTTDHQVKFMLDKIQLNGPIVVVSPNTEMVKKARKFQLGFKKVLQTDDIHLAVFASPDSGSGPYDVKKLELLGNPNFKDAEVIIVDDMVDTAYTAAILSSRLMSMGAKNVYLCASHGIFADNAMKYIDESPIKNVIVTNTLPLPSHSSPKIQQMSVSNMIAQVILAEHFRSSNSVDDKYIIED